MGLQLQCMQLWCLMIDQQERKRWFQAVLFSQSVKRKYCEAGKQLAKNLLITVVTCERSLHDTPEVGQHGFQWIGNGAQSPLTLIGKGRVYGRKYNQAAEHM